MHHDELGSGHRSGMDRQSPRGELTAARLRPARAMFRRIPYHRLLRLELLDLGPPTAVELTGQVDVRGVGRVHGGAIASLIDATCGVAAAATCAHVQRTLTTELRIRYLAAGKTLPLTALASVIRGDGQCLELECHVTDAHADEVAVAWATLSILPTSPRSY